ADIIIYHLHQAVEKLLKALIIKSSKRFEKMHFLDRLLAEIIGDYPELEELRDSILELNLYLPKLRYPYGDEIKTEEAIDVYRKFKRTREVLLSLLGK
ncbi:MAG: HEPN domain-containing protein, partial [Candidatus Margulisiibacteriota bacterium]